jgi:hypothetical protein
VSTFKKGDRARVKATARGPAGNFRKSCGREGVIESISSLAAVLKFSDKRGDLVIVPPTDLEPI